LLFAHENMNPCFSSRRNFGEAIKFEDCSLRSLDADGFLAEPPQESPLQFEESSASNSAEDLSVSSSNTASSCDHSDPLKEKEKEGPGDAAMLKKIALSGGVVVAVMFLAGPIMKLFRKCFNGNDDTPIPDTGAQNEILNAPARGALNRGGQVAQEGAHQSSRSSIKGALTLQKDLS
jgi:hypothetical protein